MNFGYISRQLWSGTISVKADSCWQLRLRRREYYEAPSGWVRVCDVRTRCWMSIKNICPTSRHTANRKYNILPPLHYCTVYQTSLLVIPITKCCKKGSKGLWWYKVASCHFKRAWWGLNVKAMSPIRILIWWRALELLSLSPGRDPCYSPLMQFSLFGGFLLPYCDAKLQSEYQADPAIVSVCSTRDQERRTEQNIFWEENRLQRYIGYWVV